MSVRISVSEVPAKVSLVNGDEVWIQVLANSRRSWAEIRQIAERIDGELMDRYSDEPVRWLTDIHDDADDEGYEFEDWYVLERKAA